MSAAGESGSFNIDSARRALTEACRLVGLDATGAALIRLGSNAVYSLPPARMLVRIGQSTADRPAAERTVRVARWLEDVNFPATRLVPGLPQAVEADSRVVTFWVLDQDQEDWATLPELADLLRRLHWLEEPESLGLEAYDPLGEWNRRMAALSGVPAEDREFLDARAAELGKLYERLDFVLPYGVIHGDANVGNAIHDREGCPLLIDLDGFALGHREWDLVLTALYYERFGWHTREEYEGFVRNYGFDLMNWPGYPVMADLREVMMTAWLGGKVDGEPEVRAEFDKRMRALRTDGSRRDWAPI